MNRILPLPCLLGLALLSLDLRPARADVVSYYAILKSQEYIQTNAAAPVARATAGFAFNAVVILNTPNAMRGVVVDPPGTTPNRPLTPDATGFAMRYESRFNTLAELDNAYPNGGLTTSYLITFESLMEGTREADLTFTLFGLPLGAPPVARVSNFVAAQSIDHAAPFTVRWTASGVQALDQIQLVILDGASNAVYTSPAPFTAGALMGASNHITLPPFTLQSSGDYLGHLAVARPGTPNTDSYPGAIGAAAIVRDTTFPLHTRPPANPPQLELMSAPPARLRLSGEASRIYRLQTSTDLSGWTDLFSTNSTTGTFEYTDAASPTPSPRFYRAVVGAAEGTP